MKQCHTNLFVFDETDKIPIGLMDTIKAYIDFYSEVDGVMFRKSVFIFLRYTTIKQFMPPKSNFKLIIALNARQLK